jgi:DNA modification methylase
MSLPKPYYDHKGITIYHGNCLEIMPHLEPVDLVLTDPPYGVKRDKGFEGFGGFGGFGQPIARRRFEDDNWDSKRPPRETFALILDSAIRVLIFGGNFFADILPRGTHWIVWDKLNTMPTFGDCELIWTNIGRKSIKKITVEYNGLIGKEAVRLHPTQKPVKLLIKILKEYSGVGNIVLDPFIGSGTTLVAAKELGRKAIGIEIEEKYCEIAAERLAQEVFEWT